MLMYAVIMDKSLSNKDRALNPWYDVMCLGQLHQRLEGAHPKRGPEIALGSLLSPAGTITLCLLLSAEPVAWVGFTALVLTFITYFTRDIVRLLK